MPRAEKTTMELKKDLDRITEKYKRALEKDNQKIADIVRKYFGDDPDLVRLDDALSKAADNSGAFVSSGRESPVTKVQNVPKKNAVKEEQSVPTDGTDEGDDQGGDGQDVPA